MNFDLPHRRFNPLTREWVLVSPHRAKRPWLGQMEKTPPENLPSYDPTCYLCPGNERAAGRRNPPYNGTYVFDNDFPALLSPEQQSDVSGQSSVVGSQQSAVSGRRWPDEGPGGTDNPNRRTTSSIFLAEPASGICRVVCFSRRHDLSLPELTQEEVEGVVATWTEQTRQLGDLENTSYVQVFENKGAMMGASNSHPHSQIWSSSYIPNEPGKEIASQSDYLRQHGSCLLCDVLAAEQSIGERIVAANDHFTALVPYWAVWPFEILLLAHRHFACITDLGPPETAALADILRRITARYDNLFEISFPYSMGFHQAPTDGKPHEECHFHAHYYPPLLRSATVRKFMVGYELLATPQRDLTPETAAERLRTQSELHYRLSHDIPNLSHSNPNLSHNTP
jgi:UDPglucose--hexose-1-phosphate uridylyltransferase